MLFSILKDELKLYQEIESDGILDQKWCFNMINGCSTLAVATSNKKVVLYKLNAELVQLERIAQLDIDESDGSDLLVLSLDWSTCKYFSAEPEIVCSDSKGNLHRLKLSNNKLNLLDTWNAHSFEAWISAFNYWDPNVVFTGAIVIRPNVMN